MVENPAKNDNVKELEIGIFQIEIATKNEEERIKKLVEVISDEVTTEIMKMLDKSRETWDEIKNHVLKKAKKEANQEKEEEQKRKKEQERFEKMMKEKLKICTEKTRKGKKNVENVDQVPTRIL